MKSITFQDILDTPYTQELRVWRNLDFVRTNMTNKALIDNATHLKYLTMLRQKRNTRKVFVGLEEGAPFGVVNFAIHKTEGYIEPGMYLMNSSFLGKGYGMAIQYARLEYIFEVMPEGRMRTIVLASNERNQRLQYKSGGILEEHTEVVDEFGHRQTAYVISINREAWMAKRENMKKEIVQRLGDVHLGRIPTRARFI